MERRRFLQMGAAAGTAAALAPSHAFGQTLPRRFEVAIEPADYELIDGTFIFVLFFTRAGDLLHPVLRATAGEVVDVIIHNKDTRPHAITVPGVVNIPAIGPNQTARLNVTIPEPGVYIYFDPLNFPINRVLGLNGALIVTPKVEDGRTPLGSPTPYDRSQQTPQIQALFDELGKPPLFPGNKWDPTDPGRDKSWVITEMDPMLAKRIDDGEVIDGRRYIDSFLPRYFMMNHVSGFDTADHANLPDDRREHGKLIEPEGCEGQPTILRCINAGLCTHSLHIHGNAVYHLTEEDAQGRIRCNDNIVEVDTWRMPPGARKDMLLPFHRPRDIPAAAWPPKQEPFPLRFVMHCHCEMSNTAGGGNYPQGLVTHWEMTHPLAKCEHH